MDYGRLLSRAWDIVRNNLFLIALGVLVALSSGGNGGSGGGGGGSPSSYNPGTYSTPVPGQNWQSTPPDFSQLSQLPYDLELISGLGIAVLIVVIVVVLIVGIAFWVVGRIATGGLIAGVNQIETEKTSSFSMAWNAGWQKCLRLIGIDLIPALPALFGVVLAVVVVLAMVGGPSKVLNDPNAFASNMFSDLAAMWLTLAAILCPTILISVVLGIVATFAERACMLEDKGVIESYSRGWEVLTGNLGPAVLLALIQIGIQIALFLVLFGPALFLACCCCCIGWAISLILNGAILAYFSTMWTLAWREWTGGEPGGFTIEKAPAV